MTHHGKISDRPAAEGLAADTIFPSLRGVVFAASSLVVASLAAALLPIMATTDWHDIVGALFIFAGLAETVAGLFRPSARSTSVAPGAVTMGTGFIMLVDGYPGLFSLAWVIAGWLAMRGAILLWASYSTHGSLRIWTLIGAAKEFLVLAFLVVALSTMTLPEVLFEASGHLDIELAATLALTFIITAMLLFEVAHRDFARPD